MALAFKRKKKIKIEEKVQKGMGPTRTRHVVMSQSGSLILSHVQFLILLNLNPTILPFFS